MSATAFARAAVQRLARALEARDAAAVLDAGCLAAAVVRREGGAAARRRRAAAMLDAVLLAVAGPLPDAVRERLEGVAEELAAPDPAGEDVLDAGDRMARVWQEIVGMLAAPPPTGVADAVQTCLAERLHGRVRLADLARALGYSPSHVCALVQRITGERFSVLRRRLQLEQARAALRRGLSVKQAAAEAGFADPAYFSRVFRREHGVAPGRWRVGVPSLA